VDRLHFIIFLQQLYRCKKFWT